MRVNILFVRKPEGKKLLRISGRRLVDNIKMNLREIGWGIMDWIDPAHDRNQWRHFANKTERLGSLEGGVRDYKLIKNSDPKLQLIS
jgi:hypothetical protein